MTTITDADVEQAALGGWPRSARGDARAGRCPGLARH